MRDRIKSLRRVAAKDLIPNPKNWRTHPDAQRKALEGVLDQIGMADAILVRETDEGLMIIDGHLRADTLDENDKVPCLVLDVDESEADALLATHDVITEMAHISGEHLTALLEQTEFESDAVNEMLDALATQAGLAIEGWHDDLTDPEGIKTYDEADETVAIRIEVKRDGHEEVVEAIKGAIDGREAKIQVL